MLIATKTGLPFWGVNYSDEVTFYEDGIRVISNGTSLRVQFDYNFTERSQAGLNWIDDDMLFPP
jgi:hypothetical protein